MADVFLSYSRDDKTRVERLVKALRQRGLSVWWDDDIAPNAAWEATIETELEQAKAVIVMWSPSAAASENVKGEARRARHAGKLVQAFVAPCEPPLFFGERQGVDLTEWQGEEKHPDFQTLVIAVEAIRDGKKPPQGVGHIPKRRAPWIYLLIAPLILLCAPFQLDWWLLARIALIGGFVFVLTTRPLRPALWAFAAAMVLSIGLDAARFRLPVTSYYIAECSFGEFDCIYGRSYSFGQRRVDVMPLIWGRAHTIYLRAVAGERQFSQRFMRREQLGARNALLSPAEMMSLAYMDGGAPTRWINVTYQPLSPRRIESFPYGSLVYDFSVNFPDRPDVDSELAFAAGYAGSDEPDLLSSDMLEAYGLSVPSYRAARADSASLAFATPVDTNDKTALWRRAVVNDALFQLQASDNLDRALLELSDVYTSLPELERLFIDTLTLAHWCGRMEQVSALAPCVAELARIDAAVGALEADDVAGGAAKIRLIRQVLRAVALVKLWSVRDAAFAERANVDDYALRPEVATALQAALLQRFPAVGAYLSDEEAEPVEALRIRPEEMSLEALSQYVEATAQLNRSDALQALLPLRRALEADYIDYSAGGRSWFDWFRMAYGDLAAINEQTTLTPATIPAIFALLNLARRQYDERDGIYRRYELVDSAVADLGGAAPPFLAASRAEMADAVALQQGYREAVSFLIARIETGATAEELTGVLDIRSVRDSVAPQTFDIVGGLIDDFAIISRDLGLPDVSTCLDDVSSAVRRLRNTVRDQGGASRVVREWFEAGDDEEATRERLPESCRAYQSLDEGEQQWRTFYRTIFDNALLNDPGGFFAEGLDDRMPISGRQYILAVAFDTEASVVELADWFGADRARAESAADVYTFFEGLYPQAEDFARLRGEICERWREPVWAYPQLDNTAAGWRLTPVFFSILHLSEACGTATDVVRTHLEEEFGASVVSAVLASQRPSETRFAIGRHFTPGAVAGIANQQQWTPSDAGAYARFRLYAANTDRWWRISPDRSAVLQEFDCPMETCDREEMRTLAALLTSYIQSHFQTAWLKESFSPRSLFYQSVWFFEEDGFWGDDDEDRIDMLSEVPSAFATLSLHVDVATLRPIADALPDRLNGAHYRELARIAEASAMEEDERAAYWSAVHAIFQISDASLALNALDQLRNAEGYGSLVAVRRAQLLSLGGHYDDAAATAIAMLRDTAEAPDSDLRLLAVENARQVFFAARACPACRRALMAELLEAINDLERRRGLTRAMSLVRGAIAEDALDDPGLRDLVEAWAEHVLRYHPYMRGAGVTAEDFARDSEVTFALEVRAGRARGGGGVEHDVLAMLTEDPGARASHAVLAKVRALGAAASAPPWTEVDVWFSRGVRAVEAAASENGGLSPDVIDVFEEVTQFPSARVAPLRALVTTLRERLVREYDAGRFPISPLALHQVVDSTLGGPTLLPNAIYANYLASEAFSDLAEDQNGRRIWRDLEGLRLILADPERARAIVNDANRDNIIDVSRAFVTASPSGIISLTEGILHPAAPDRLRSELIFEVLDGHRLDVEPASPRLTPLLRYIGQVHERELEEAANAAAQARARASYAALIGAVIDEYMSFRDNCCAPADENTDLFLAFVRDRLAYPDACDWLRNAVVDVRTYARVAGVRGANVSQFGPNVARLARGERLCPA